MILVKTQTICNYWKCNFPMDPRVRLSVAVSVFCHYVIAGSYTSLLLSDHFLRQIHIFVIRTIHLCICFRSVFTKVGDLFINGFIVRPSYNPSNYLL